MTGRYQHSDEILTDQRERRKRVHIKMVPWMLKGICTPNHRTGKQADTWIRSFLFNIYIAGGSVMNLAIKVLKTFISH